MTCPNLARPFAGRAMVLAVCFCAGGAASAGAQETASVTVPVGISFPVTDVSRSTAGSPGETRVEFSNAIMAPGNALRISVRAEAEAFTPPGGPGIPSSLVSWKAIRMSGGTGWNAGLSSSSYTLVFLGDAGQTSGYIDLGWMLAPTGSAIRAGSHQLSIRWKIESITP